MSEIRITARKNPLLQQVRRLLSSKKERETAGLFVADGTKLLQEAVEYYPGLDTVILADVTNDLGATKGNGILRDLYNRAIVSDLNIDEDRFSPAFIEFFGQTVISFLKSFFGTIKK